MNYGWPVNRERERGLCSVALLLLPGYGSVTLWVLPCRWWPWSVAKARKEEEEDKNSKARRKRWFCGLNTGSTTATFRYQTHRSIGNIITHTTSWAGGQRSHQSVNKGSEQHAALTPECVSAMKEITHTLTQLLRRALQGGVQIAGILYDVTGRADSLQTLTVCVCVCVWERERGKPPFLQASTEH